jgi:phosphatidylglycerophosphatase A
MAKWEIFLLVVLLLALVGPLFFPAADNGGVTARREFNLVLWLAEGFGVGRAPFAPGTFGSVVGVLWFALLARASNPLVLLGGTVAGLAFSVWVCGVAEKMLGKKDPGAVVMDEITALPVCFFAWVGLVFWKTGAWPEAGYFFSRETWPLTLGVFAAFRFFDVLKPWPARQSQALPGGWGITVDDVLAAVYVNIVVLAAWWAGAPLVR